MSLCIPMSNIFSYMIFKGGKLYCNCSILVVFICGANTATLMGCTYPSMGQMYLDSSLNNYTSTATMVYCAFIIYCDEY